jgi:hypothetical protein
MLRVAIDSLCARFPRSPHAATRIIRRRRQMRRAWVLCLVLAACGRDANRFETGPVDLRRWTAVNYRLVRDAQGYAAWVVDEQHASVTQLNNADPSIFVSDRNLDRQTVQGTWLVEGGSDDDLIGFVFGYRDPGHFYVFDWKGASQDKAKRGMSVKMVDVAYDGAPFGKLEPGKPFEESELWDTAGAPGKIRLLHHEDTPGWNFNRPYVFRLDFGAGEFRIVVNDGATTLYDHTLRDRTYLSGRFGFYNYSQGGVVYRGFETRMQPGAAVFSPWVVVIVLTLLFLAIAVAVLVRRRQHGHLTP